MWQVNALVHAVNSFPERMPKRWSLISQLVSLVQESAREGVYIDLATSVQPTKGNAISITLPCVSH